MEKPISLTRNPSPNPHHGTSPHSLRCPQDRDMVYDFNQTCKTYDKTFYKKEYFRFTPCPACPSIGRFNLHGSYGRYAIFMEKCTIEYRLIELKRIKCKSCNTTHAVMPGDIIPYKAITLFVFIFVLVSFYLRKVPVLETAKTCDFSFQFIYSVIEVFHAHINNVRQYIREVFPESTPPNLEARAILNLMKMPYMKFQSGYTKINRRPCFMCKFFTRAGTPPVGIVAPAGATT